MRVKLTYTDEKTGKTSTKIVTIDATPDTDIATISDLAIEALPDHPDSDYGWLFEDLEELD